MDVDLTFRGGLSGRHEVRWRLFAGDKVVEKMVEDGFEAAV